MEDFLVEKLDMETLKKWGATLNNAKELGFQVGFADDLLRKNSYAYLLTEQAWTRLKKRRFDKSKDLSSDG
ncbi:hypothetical protein CXB51_029653 [Gossypium anomalum]|uniref:Uncharacterized protein n=1 Tax=Gossypium anomalum TaxID=47600 RepID=A0A8J5YGP0_9ROSI|nr:hypothetical protein CXB51_029653 [Gossypium anomalum]